MSVRISGTTTKCKVCGKTAYPNESTTLDTIVYHNACMKCNECGNKVTPTNCATYEGTLFCKPHFKQLFKLRGKYTDVNSPTRPSLRKGSASSDENPPASNAAKMEGDPAPAIEEQMPVEE